MHYSGASHIFLNDFGASLISGLDRPATWQLGINGGTYTTDKKPIDLESVETFIVGAESDNFKFTEETLLNGNIDGRGGIINL